MIYQYDGRICASVKTDFGNHWAGTKAPHKNAEPSATTLTIPFIAFLLFIAVDINKAIVREQNVNNNVFKKYDSYLCKLDQSR